MVRGFTGGLLVEVNGSYKDGNITNGGLRSYIPLTAFCGYERVAIDPVQASYLSSRYKFIGYTQDRLSHIISDLELIEELNRLQWF